MYTLSLTAYMVFGFLFLHGLLELMPIIMATLRP